MYKKEFPSTHYIGIICFPSFLFDSTVLVSTGVLCISVIQYQPKTMVSQIVWNTNNNISKAKI